MTADKPHGYAEWKRIARARYVALCVCGWTSPERSTRDHAEALLTDHYLSAIRRTHRGDAPPATVTVTPGLATATCPVCGFAAESARGPKAARLVYALHHTAAGAAELARDEQARAEHAHREVAAERVMLRADAAQRVAAGQTIDLTAGGPDA